MKIDRSSLRTSLENHLLSTGKLSANDIKHSCQLADEQGLTLGAVLSRAGLVSDGDLARLYCDILNLPPYHNSLLPKEADLSQYKDNFLRTAHILPLEETQHGLSFAIADPEDTFSIKAMEQTSDKVIEYYIATRQQIRDALDQLAGKASSDMTGLIDVLNADDNKAQHEQAMLTQLKEQAADAPIVRLVNLLIQRAIENRASDIHIESFEKSLKVRYRIDGLLRLTEAPPAHASAAIISRIKLMARMDIAERRLPQDGGFQIRVQGKLVDLRVSTTPTQHGESLVLRILDQQAVRLDLDSLGFSPADLESLTQLLARPDGIILVTGPTGSGKSTTLHAALKILNTDERKIMTVEDPVEYQLDGINQVQVKPDIGLTFPYALRAIVRQDPDIIMVGEMRDLETAKTAIQSALTGHLVLSTLHTNNAGSAVTRLLDMGIDDYLVTSTVNAVVAQRLVRRLCTACRMAYSPSTELIGRLFPGQQIDTLYKPTGCSRCQHSGYAGRVVICEIMQLSGAIKDAILKGGSGYHLQQLAIAEGMLSMRNDGLRKVQAGITTIDEVSRVTLL